MSRGTQFFAICLVTLICGALVPTAVLAQSQNLAHEDSTTENEVSIGDVTIEGDCNTIGIIYGDINCSPGLSISEKKRNFASLLQHMFTEHQSQYMSSHNMTIQLKSAMERQVDTNTDPNYWIRFAKIWNKHVDIFNVIYRELARCVSLNICIASEEVKPFCDQVRFQYRNFSYLYTQLEKIPAPINRVYGGAVPIFPGNDFVVPSIGHMETIAVQGCPTGEE